MVRAILKEYNGTVMVISHDRYFLDEVVTKIFDLEDGEIHVYHTNYSRFVEEKEERLLQEFQAYQEQQKKIKKMKEAIKRLREWANQANPPNEGLHKREKYGTCTGTYGKTKETYFRTKTNGTSV